MTALNQRGKTSLQRGGRNGLRSGWREVRRIWRDGEGLRLRARAARIEWALMKRSRGCLIFLLMTLAWLTPGCATKTKPDALETTQGAAPVVAQAWLRTELYFSIGEWTETALSTAPEARWAEFLDREVTPRFPSGLTVLDAYGQWRGEKPGAVISRERSRVLVIMHPATADASAKIEAIRAAWKALTGEESVLRVTQPAEVSF